MLTGVNFEQAIDYWKRGREVIVIDRNSRNESGGYDNFPFEELFRNVELLADVPTVEDPEFKRDVEKMIQSVSREEKNITPPSERPEVIDMSPAGKRNGNQERARQLAEQGMTAAQIAKQLGVKYNTAYYYLHPEKCSRTKKKKPILAEEDTGIRATGWNKDRHACRSCRYRAGRAEKGCDYYVLTDHERGCDPADCDKYEKGARAEKDGQTGT